MCLAWVILLRSPDKRKKSRPLALSSVTGGGPVDLFRFSKTPSARSPILGLFYCANNGPGVEKVEETLCSRREHGIPKLL